jgi:hypothetical protein
LKTSNNQQHAQQNVFDEHLNGILKNILPLLLKGHEIPVETIVSIVLNEIRRAEENPNCNGWIIDGFPNTKEAAALLDKQLSGYDPTVQYSPKSYTIAPLDLESDETYPFKSFTSVIFIDVSNEAVFERTAGQKVDSLTGELYHMVFNPPEPENVCIFSVLVTDTNSRFQVDIIERLTPIEYIQYDKALLSSKLLNYNKCRKQLLRWYEPFNNIVVIQAGDDMDQLIQFIGHELEESKRVSQPEVVIEEIDVSSPIPDNISQLPESRSTTPMETRSEVSTPLTRQTPTPNLLSSIRQWNIDPDMAKEFDNEWASMEDIYRTSVLTVFNNLKEEQKIFLKSIFDSKQHFIKYLKIPDERQKMVNEFIRSFNDLPRDLRANLDVKRELQKRVDELQERLWNLSDTKKDEAEQELRRIKEQEWVEEHKRIVIRNFLQLLDLEVRRYAEQSKFVADYFTEVYKREPIILSPEDLMIDVIHTPVETKKKVTTANSKSRKSNRSQTPAADPLDMNIDSCYERAKSVVTTIRALLTEAEKDTKKKDNKKKNGKKSVDIEELAPPEISLGLDMEEQLYQERLECVVKCCKDILEVETNEKINHIIDVMDTWIGQRYKAEMDSIKNMIIFIRDTIEQEQPLENYLLLNDTFVEDKSIKFIEPEKQFARPEIHGPKEDFSFEQIQQFKKKLKLTAPDGFIPKKDFVTLIQILADSTFGPADFPQKWSQRNQEQLDQIAGVFCFDSRQLINWTEFLVALVLSYCRVQPSIGDLCKMRDYFISISPESEMINLSQYMDCDMWFEELENRHPSLTVKELKESLFCILSKAEDTMSYGDLLLYLCLDESPVKSISRVFAVLDSSKTLNSQQLYRLFHFNNTPVTGQPDLYDEEDDFCLDQLNAVVAECEKFSRLSQIRPADGTITFDQFCNSALARMMLENCSQLKRKAIVT